MDSRGKEILEQLLRERTPQERERLSQAWERTAAGDPESLPVLFALSDRFSLEAHAALLEEMRLIHGSLEDMAREIGKGARATVERTERASKAAFDQAARFGDLILRLEEVVGGQEAACRRMVSEVEQSARDIERSLEAARRQHGETVTWSTLVFLAWLTAMMAGFGFWAGGQLRGWKERQPADEPADEPLPLRMPARETR